MSITIPEFVTTIGECAFFGCSRLESITIPNSVTAIGEKAFFRCSKLASLAVAPNNKRYDSRDNCNAIIETATNKLITGCRNTIIPNSVTKINIAAFFGCPRLTSITIPNSVLSIGIDAFTNCPGLDTLICLATNPPTCSRLHSRIERRPKPPILSLRQRFGKQCKLFVPKESIGKYKAAEGWKDFTHISAIEDMDEED